MKKKLKKISLVLMAGALVASLTACGGGESSEGGASGEAEFKDAKIALAYYQDSGPAVTAVHAFLDEVGKAMNTEFTYVTFSQTDEATNVATVQQLISSGVDGIIGTMDLGTQAILDECEAAGIYYAGYVCDFETSYTTMHDEVFGNEAFLGTVSDGSLTDNVQGGQYMFDSLIEYNEAHPDDPVEHVSMTMFPEFAYPIQRLCADQFVAAVEEYNKTAETPITVAPLDEETDILQFAPIDSTYFSKHPGIDGIISFAAGTSFVYPAMVSAGVDSEIKLFTVGLDGGEEDNFGSAGTQTYQQVVVTPVETVIYPLVLMINKINDVEFSDMPETAERIATNQFVVNSDEDMEKMLTNIYSTGNYEDALITAEDVAELTAVANPDATYAGLVETVQGFSIDSIE